MPAAVDLASMTVPEKLLLMEQLWGDLSSREGDLISPAWHDEVLAERDRLIASGEEKFIDWEISKKRLRSELE